MIATNEAYTRHLDPETAKHLERAAKNTAVAATQTFAAANAARSHIKRTEITETLMMECSEISRYVPPVVQKIKDNQTARTPEERFQAQFGLIHETSKLVHPAFRLVQVSRSSVPHVDEERTASRLMSTSEELAAQLAELRIALNNATQQINFEQHQLEEEHFEEEHAIIDEATLPGLIIVDDNLQQDAHHEIETDVVHGIVDTISRSISLADQTPHQAPTDDSFVDAQTRIVVHLNVITQIATDIPLADTHALGRLSFKLADSYKGINAFINRIREFYIFNLKR